MKSCSLQVLPLPPKVIWHYPSSQLTKQFDDDSQDYQVKVASEHQCSARNNCLGTLHVFSRQHTSWCWYSRIQVISMAIEQTRLRGGIFTKNTTVEHPFHLLPLPCQKTNTKKTSRSISNN